MFSKVRPEFGNGPGLNIFLEKTLTPTRCSLKSRIWGIGYLSGTV